MTPTFKAKIKLFVAGVVITTLSFWAGKALATDVTKMVISDDKNEVILSLPYRSVNACRQHRQSMFIMQYVMIQKRGASKDKIYITCTPIKHTDSEVL